MYIKSLRSNKYFLIVVSIISIITYSFIASASPAIQYSPGETLNPSNPACLPDGGCGVQALEIERGTGAPSSTPTGLDPIFYINETNGDAYTYDGTWSQITGGGGAATATNGLSVIGSDIALGGTLIDDTDIDTDGNLFTITSPYSVFENGTIDIGIDATWIRKDISPTLITAMGMLDLSLLGQDADSILIGRFDLMGGNATSLQIQPTSGDVRLDTVDDLRLAVGDEFNVDGSQVFFTFDEGTFNIDDFALNNPYGNISLDASGFGINSEGNLNINSDANLQLYTNGAGDQLSLTASPTTGPASLAIFAEDDGSGLAQSALFQYNNNSTNFAYGMTMFPDNLTIYRLKNGVPGYPTGFDDRGLYMTAAGVQLFSYSYDGGGNPQYQGSLGLTDQEIYLQVGQSGGGNSNAAARMSIGTGFTFDVNDGSNAILRAMTIQNDNGYVSIGTDLSPDQRLDVDESRLSGYAASFSNRANDAMAYGIFVEAGENSGNGTLVQFADGDGGLVGSITYSGSTTTYGTLSDQRLKSSIVDTAMSLDDLMRIKVRDYVYNQEGTGKLHTGYIAQELIDIYPDAVYAPAEGMWSVDYGKITPLIIKSVQDLNLKMEGIESFAADQSFVSKIREWLGSAANGIVAIFSEKVTTEELCVKDSDGETCITRAQLNQILAGQQIVPAPSVPSVPESQPEPEESPVSGTEPAPEGEQSVDPEPEVEVQPEPEVSDLEPVTEPEPVPESAPEASTDQSVIE